MAPAEIPSSAEVVVIGGGAIGTSVLYHLTAAGCSDALLIERETLGSGSTSKAAGGIRAQFSDELNIRMSLENIRRFEHFDDEFGVDIDFKQWGYLIMVEEEMLPVFREALALQNSLGVPSEFLDPAAVEELIPQLRVDDIAGATFCPIDGYATPESLVQGYFGAARRAGARAVQGCAVRSVVVEDGAVAGVRTDQGDVSTARVVLAAGVWSVDIAATVGLELPVRPEARYVWFTDGPDPLPHELPLTIDFRTGFYFHREGDGLLFGGREDRLDAMAPAATHRLPVLEDMGIRPGWWGYYEMSPDRNALVGAAVEPSGLFYGTGFSGHGFQQSPVVGEYLADLALGRSPAFDLGPFSVERFSDSDLRPERHVV